MPKPTHSTLNAVSARPKPKKTPDAARNLSGRTFSAPEIPVLEDRSAAHFKGLPALDVVTAKELAAAWQKHPKTILRRLELYRIRPNAPLAIPHLYALGKPYLIRRAVALRLMTEEAARA